MSRKRGFRCFECDEPADHAHHVVPFSLGGTRTLPLCHDCHEKAHQRSTRFKDHSRRTKEGQQRAKESGKTLGRPKKVLCMETIQKLLDEGKTINRIAQVFGVANNTVKRVIREHQERVRDQREEVEGRIQVGFEGERGAA